LSINFWLLTRLTPLYLSKPIEKSEKYIAGKETNTKTPKLTNFTFKFILEISFLKIRKIPIKSKGIKIFAE